LSVRLNLKLKFTLTICFLLVVTTTMLGWIFLLQVEKSALREVKEKGILFARGLADGAELGVLTHNTELLQLLLHPLGEQDDVVYAAVADERGVVLAEHRDPTVARVPPWAAVPARPAAVKGPADETLAERLQNGTTVYFIAVPILARRGAKGGEEARMIIGGPFLPASDHLLGTACVGVSAMDVVKDLRNLRRGLMLATLAVLLFGIGIAILLVRVIIDPVKQLAHATRRIAAGDLQVRMPRAGRDEIGALAESFNQMALRLAESRQELERSNAELECKVQERTRALKETQGQLVQAEKMTVVGQLVSGVAHELNNPLAGVLGYAQLLLRKGVSQDVGRGLKKIEAEAERCKRIVQNLLIFARKHRPTKTLLDLNAVIEATLELRSYHLKVDNVTVIRDLETNLPRTMADTNQIQQVLMNIINNAQQAMAEIPGRRRILTLRSRRHEGRIWIQVGDTGPGIAQEHLGKIFDPFFTTKEVGRGTGLGLSICYGIVEEHHGTIRVDGTDGEGTTFTIDLPVVGVAAEGKAAPADPVTGPMPVPRTGRVLLVDDETSILEVIGDVLKLDGHQVVATTNGQAALSRLQAEKFDVIVSDLKMPGMSGQELFTRLMQLDAAMARRLIFTTGDLASAETLRFLERTGNAYLQKPFDLNTVRRTIQTILSAN
jgi:signal transduction histidine kinase